MQGDSIGQDGKAEGVGGAVSGLFYFSIAVSNFSWFTPTLLLFFFYIIGSRHLQRLPAFHIGKRFICARVAIIAKWFLGFCKHGKALGPDPVSGPGF